jgi:hypothetical protein
LQVVQPIILTSDTSRLAYSMSSKTDHAGVTTLKRLDQGHLHPNLEVPRLTRPGLESKPGILSGRQTLQKIAPFLEQLVNSYLKRLHVSPRQYIIFIRCRKEAEGGGRPTFDSLISIAAQVRHSYTICQSQCCGSRS